MHHRFLIIQTAFIGDVVLATAVAEKLHSYYPDASIDFVLRKGNEALLKGHPFIKTVYVWEKKGGKYRNLSRIINSVRNAKYSHVINIHRFAASGLITCLSRAKVKVGFDKNPFSWCYTQKIAHSISTPADIHYVHEVERNQSLIASFTDDEPLRPKLYPSNADYEKVRLYKDGPFICIAPSSVWFTKRYPEEEWVRLVRELPQEYRVILIGGREDALLCEAIIDKAGRLGTIHLCGSLTLMQSAALMQDAVMNYTCDSGPMHFASAVNAPTTAVYCSTHPCFGFGPLSETRSVVQVENLYCKPCGLHGYAKCPEGHFRCATEINSSDLLWWTSKEI